MLYHLYLDSKNLKYCKSQNPQYQSFFTRKNNYKLTSKNQFPAASLSRITSTWGSISGIPTGLLNVSHYFGWSHFSGHPGQDHVYPRWRVLFEFLKMFIPSGDVMSSDVCSLPCYGFRNWTMQLHLEHVCPGVNGNSLGQSQLLFVSRYCCTKS